MKFESIVAVLAVLGVGGLLGNYFRVLWERQNKAQLQKLEFKESRYKCIIILMLSYLDFDKSKPMLHQHGRQYIDSVKDLKDELKLEWNNMILFAPSELLTALHTFIESPSQVAYQDVAVAMRKDLWGGRLSSKEREQLKKFSLNP